MIRYLVAAGFLISCAGLPLHLQADTPSVRQPLAHVSTPSHAKDKLAKTADKSLAKTSTVTTKPSTSQKSVPSVVASSKTMNSSFVLPSKTSKVSKNNVGPQSDGRLARLTAYWASEGDHYTKLGISSTGIRLHDGYCAVDPRIIPYGSMVTISGLGKYLAVDTGSAVISRQAARETGHTPAERAALVIDLYFESRRDGENFAESGPKFASITWQKPNSANSVSSNASYSMVAEADWNKLINKQLSE